jgi:hypothetical protein
MTYLKLLLRRRDKLLSYGVAIWQMLRVLPRLSDFLFRFLFAFLVLCPTG